MYIYIYIYTYAHVYTYTELLQNPESKFLDPEP